MEVWKAIPGFVGFYEVSNLGNVRSLDRKCTYKDGRAAFFKGKVLKPVINSDGYKQVQLKRGQTKATLKVHRLVAEVFISNPESHPEVNHKDEDKTNNCMSNLEWCDHLYNSRYGTRGKRISAKRSHPVFAYLPGEPDVVLRFKSMKSAANHFQVSGETIRQAVKYGWKCRGYVLVQGTEVVAQQDGFYFCR